MIIFSRVASERDNNISNTFFHSGSFVYTEVNTKDHSTIRQINDVILSESWISALIYRYYSSLTRCFVNVPYRNRSRTNINA
jgi:hypothetical protein